VYDFDVRDMTTAEIEKTKDHIAHLLASAFAGVGTAVGSRGRTLARLLGGDGPCTVIGDPATATALDAAFANSSMMSAPGLDDVLMPAGVHPGQVILPAVLAVGEQHGRSGADVLTAMAVGYEVIGKLGGLLWCYEARTPQRATIPFGAFGPTAAAAKLLRLSPAQTANAIGYAANSAMGLSENPFFDHYYGLTTRNGITAAVIASAGGTTPPTTIEGDSGFFRSIFGTIPPDLDAIIDRLGRDLEINRAEFKHYPSTGLNQAAILLMREMMAAHGLRRDNVTAITLRISKRRENHRVGYDNGPLTSSWQAQSSAPFNLSVVLADGDVDPARYDDIDDPVLAAVRANTTVVLVDHADPLYAELEVTTTDGDRHRRTADRWLRPPDVPRHAKLRRHGSAVLGEERVARLDALLAKLEALDDVGELTACLRSDAS
jgi:2-methylcitrate dehydratase PrpD